MFNKIMSFALSLMMSNSITNFAASNTSKPIPPTDVAVNFAVSVANDDSHGYSQDPKKRWGNPEYDCSALVITSYEKAGIKVKSAGATYSGNMRKAFIACGFIDIKEDIDNGAPLKKGDVLLKEGVHAAMVSDVRDGEIYVVEASGNTIKEHRKDHTIGDQNGKEIWNHKYKYNPKTWTHILRYTQKNN